jgi:hypothetical protein
MPSNKTLLVWMIATNLFWMECIITIFAAFHQRDSEIASLQNQINNQIIDQNDYDKVVQDANLTIFSALNARIKSSQNDIEQLQKSCAFQIKENANEPSSTH